MAPIKEKGHNIKLNSIVVHKINKTAGEKNLTTLKLAKAPLILEPILDRFIADIRDSFRKKSLPTHGVFEDELSYNHFYSSLLEYKSRSTDFFKFTVESMKYYESIIKSRVAATGGFIIFADYEISESSSDRYLLILSLNNKQGYLLEEALSIKEIKNLDLSKMDLAAMINFSRWDKSLSGDISVKTYLTFIRGKKNISDYFQEFIGCLDKSTASQSSTALMTAVDQYIAIYNIDINASKEIKKNLFEYCRESNKNKKEITLSFISSLFDTENPSKFAEFASSEEYGVSEVIKYDNKVLGRLKYIVFDDGDDFSIKFNKSLIDQNNFKSKPKIHLDKESKTLTISNVSDELISQF